MIENIKLMAIIREVEPQYAVQIVKVLLEEGIRSLEVSLSDPDMGFGCLQVLKAAFREDQIDLGAGTVTRKEEIDRLAAMGIRFFLTPGYDDGLVEYGIEMGMEVLPGVLTPGEVLQALNRGITRMKLFPADAFGLSYIKSLKGPFPKAEFVAVGGVNENNMGSFLDAGFVGAAAGSGLIPRKATSENLEQIRQKARLYGNILKGRADL